MPLNGIHLTPSVKYKVPGGGEDLHPLHSERASYLTPTPLASFADPSHALLPQARALDRAPPDLQEPTPTVLGL